LDKKGIETKWESGQKKDLDTIWTRKEPRLKRDLDKKKGIWEKEIWAKKEFRQKKASKPKGNRDKKKGSGQKRNLD